MIEPTAEDMAYDIKTMLEETEAAILLFVKSGRGVPGEAYQMRAAMRRAVWAEAKLEELRVTSQQGTPAVPADPQGR